MAYTAPQIGVILLKADRTMYKIGQIAYENMFAEDNEALDYERDIIFIYKKAVEFADDFFVGTEKLDKVVERLATKISAYDYGELNPIYADAATVNIPSVVAGAALNDLTDVTIANLLDNQFLRYNAATGQWINVGPGSAVRSSQAFIATAGQTVFTTSAPFDAGLFDLYVNGVKLNSLSYTTFGEYQITLNDPCAAGDIVDVVIYDPNTGINPTANTLNDLTDVNIGPLVNKQALYYNSASGLWENGLVFVPYTGATAAVDLGEFEIRAGQFTLDTSPTGTATVGTTRWNDSIGSSETTLKGGSVILKNGVDLVARVVNKVTPNTTLTKASYAAVRISGAQGQRLAVAYAQANNDANSADTIGLVTETIATNQEGFIMTMGSLEGINTTGSLQGETWADGDVLYLSPTVPGGITNVKPTGLTGHIVVVGYVEYAHANNGKIYVKTMNGWELDELHNVNINTATLANNDVLKYNSTTQLWENGVSTAGISGSGASGQVTYWTGASAVSGSNNLFWDNTNGRLNIGTTLPTTIATHNIFGSSTFVGVSIKNNSTASGSTQACIALESSTSSIASLFKTGSNYTTYKIITANDLGFYNSSAGDISILNDLTTGRIKFASGGVSTAQMTLFANGNFAINSGVTDLGVRFGVIGDTLLRGSGATSATTALTVQNSSSTNLLTIDNSGFIEANTSTSSIFVRNGIIFGATSAAARIGPSASNAINVRFTQGSTNLLGAYGSGIGNSAYLFSYPNSNNTDANTNSLWGIVHTFNPTSGSSGYIMMGLQPTINQTGGANGITRGLYVNPTLTAAADFRAIETSAGNVLFGSNFFWDNANGRLGIGTNAPDTRLHIKGDNTSSDIVFETNTYTTKGYFAHYQGATLQLAINRQITGTYSNTNAASAGINFVASNAGSLGYVSIFATNVNNQFIPPDILRVWGSGNVLIQNGGTFTDLGYRLGVVGDTLLRGSGNTSATTALTVQNSDNRIIIRATNNGVLQIGNINANSIYPFSSSVSTPDIQGTSLAISTNLSTSGNGIAIRNAQVTNRDYTSGDGNFVRLYEGYAPTSGTGTWQQLILTPTINQTGGANGITRGLYVAPTLTSAADFRAIETTNGKIVFGNLPTSSAGLPTGALWNDAGTVKIV